MFTLRPYQNKAKQDIRTAFKYGKRRVVLCMPTGAGKTVTFADMVGNSISNGMRAMILCDRKELIGQAGDKIGDLGLNPTIIAPGHKMVQNNCYLASVDTLRRRELPAIDLLIVDEAHKQSFDKMLNRYIAEFNPYVIGATATPLRTGNQNSLHEIYDEIVEPVTISDLLDGNHLVPARTFAAREDFTKVKKRGADFDNGALFDKFNSPTLYDGVLDNWNKFGENAKTICFNVNVEHSQIMTEKFKENGVSAAHLDGKTPDAQRRQILRDFKRGEFKVLNNCSVLTTGFDEPSIENVIVNRATLSLPLWLQMVGRGSRTFEGKKDFRVIDQGANVYRHGLWEEDRTWQLEKKRKRDGDGVAPVKLCECCGMINHASARVCKECNTPFPIKEKKLERAEFIEVQKKLAKRGLGNGTPKPDIHRATENELKQYAKKMGYKSGWVWQQMKIAKRV
ncbi:MAG: DEAD/DEAH box helicase [Deltaproteobacteria bacterium]|nr:DEAD/DEAH box helicase [Deltaproteobacteria bacterium]